MGKQRLTRREFVGGAAAAAAGAAAGVLLGAGGEALARQAARERVAAATAEALDGLDGG